MSIEHTNYFKEGKQWIVRVVGRGFEDDDRRTTCFYAAGTEDQCKRLCWYLTGDSGKDVTTSTGQ